MKVESILIQNFKLFENLEVSFKHKSIQETSNRFLVVGDNGTGKTTLLQAIALPLALATRKIQTVYDFEWIGFLPGRYWESGDPKIELEISFDDREIQTTKEVAKQWYDRQPESFKLANRFVEPGDNHSLTIILDGDYWQVGSDRPEERAQFQGRYYTLQLLKKTRNQSFRQYFPDLPGVFWFDQFRNLASQTNLESNSEGKSERSARASFEFGVGRLRDYLIGWRQTEESGNGHDRTDYLSGIEKLYQKIFPDRFFVEVETRPKLDSPTEEEMYFLIEQKSLENKNRRYDLVEMSGGEQSVFPMLYEFVRQQIAYSVVLIDEIDLNLHSPAAQSLVSQLRKISPTCQFIFTTHSDAVNDIITEENTFRLPGGSLCL